MRDWEGAIATTAPRLYRFGNGAWGEPMEGRMVVLPSGVVWDFVGDLKWVKTVLFFGERAYEVLIHECE